MSEFERTQPNFRLVETHHGDDLQAVAGRELGDSNRWPELIWLNQLTHPYLTDDERLVSPTVRLTGSLIKVPAPSSVWTDSADRGQVYERDCRLVKKRLLDDGSGDFLIAAGVDNLTQQLKHRIDTPRGQARRHPEYGCLVWRLKGTVNGRLGADLGARYVRAALEADYRVDTVQSVTAEVDGDAIRIQAKAEAIAGGVVDLLTDSAPS